LRHGRPRCWRRAGDDESTARLGFSATCDDVMLRTRLDARRTRLANAFSKKVENHAESIALYFMYYNFGRIHQALRVTPAMEAGVANHVWSVEEIVGLLG
jgi:hypothetical protein